ncbi:MAG: TetR/AcrR family transcriptional regulator, partial [Actinomycetia bacterium]|nr:TetR/AcrR family transcriptional regulator [Actinomycetes bacterium]
MAKKRVHVEVAASRLEAAVAVSASDVEAPDATEAVAMLTDALTEAGA